MLDLPVVSRRQLLIWGAALGVGQAAWARSPFEELERRFGLRLGVAALDTGSGRRVSFRAGERFAMCSTFKTLAVAALLARLSVTELDDRVLYSEGDLLEYAPVTRQQLAQGMTLKELCDAAIRFSDNTAANLILRRLGGPAAVTAFLRSLGDGVTRLDRTEPALNSAVPGELLDTTTPQALLASYREVALGSVLPPERRALLVDWLRRNTTSALPKPSRVRAAVPASWVVGDKTGSGSFGVANDAAVLWPPRRAPVVLVVLTSGQVAEAKGQPEVITLAAREALRLLR